MTRSIVAALGIALAGCVDVQAPPGPASGAPASFYAGIRVHDESFEDESGEVALIVHGALNPGSDVARRPRRVVNDTVYVLGIPIAPSGRFGERRDYSQRITLEPGMLAEGLSVVPPGVEGVSPNVPVARAPAFLRIGPKHAAITPGEDLVIALARAPEAFDQAFSESWNVSVRSAAGATTNIQGSGATPQTVRIPWSLLPQQPSPRYDALLRIGHQRIPAAVAAGYGVSVWFEYELRTRFHVAEPDEPDESG